ncbi:MULTISPECIES: ricin-type beta-trefoil lectin domain protein [unclassified Streptomyces]|uniref:RICIN domain-containing protein n=1 Tax=unclassified Streptomyces TaxID=2593676 RepID=UPI001BEA637F|nr:ricin-type beta-trefoil lectin domain protein [Streptomyces sp. ISL-21]MBT2610712.1 ricin-type beta-trefoil lectin domain protein [Streptomyces sp. ISL-87]
MEDRPPGQRTDQWLFVRLRAQHSDKCLALVGEQFEPGTDIVQADCADQTADWTLRGSGDRFLIKSEHCVGVAGGSRRNGSAVVYQECTENSPKWLFKPWE